MDSEERSDGKGIIINPSVLVALFYEVNIIGLKQVAFRNLQQLFQFLNIR